MKKRLICPQLPKPNLPTLLSESEAHHATRVLRLREGEVVEAMDGQGNRASTTLRLRGGHPRLEYIEETQNPSIPSPQPGTVLPLTLEMAVLKGGAMEWVVEKAVELGVKQLIPVLTDHTVIQMKNKGPDSFQERWQKIADQALKQCGRLTRMEVHLPISLETVLVRSIRQNSDQRINPGLKSGVIECRGEVSLSSMTRLWCDEKSKGQAPLLLDYLIEQLNSKNSAPGPEWRLLIGPEGGWSTTERNLLSQEAETQRIDLGPNTLRAETAALFSVSLVSSFASRLIYNSLNSL